MTCEQQLEAARLEIDALKNDVALQEKENLRLRRVIQGLEQAARDKYADHPDAKTVTRLLEAWQTYTNHHRADIRLDGKRADRVRWALKSRSPEYIEQVFEAGGKYPYVWGAKRQRFGTSDQRYDDVLTLLRDERQMETLHALMERVEPEHTVQVPQKALDKMRNRVRELEWWVGRLRGWADDEAALAQALTERLAAIEEGRQVTLREVAA